MGESVCNVTKLSFCFSEGDRLGDFVGTTSLTEVSICHDSCGSSKRTSSGGGCDLSSRVRNTDHSDALSFAGHAASAARSFPVSKSSGVLAKEPPGKIGSRWSKMIGLNPVFTSCNFTFTSSNDDERVDHAGLNRLHGAT
jgi:hypothetical protein